MVQKIKLLKISIFILIAFILCFLSLHAGGNFETNLMKTFLSHRVENSDTIVKVADKSSSVIKVVFESNNEKNLETIKENFIKNIDKSVFQIENRDISKFLEKYLSAPSNFLSDSTFISLKKGEYDRIYKQSQEALYNPMSLNLTSFENDPFLLFDDYINSLRLVSAPEYNIKDKYYDFMTLRLLSKDGLSPKISNIKIGSLVNIQNKISDKNSKVYLAGSPVHSYYTSKNSARNINIICIISSILICLLTYFYFRSLKILVPIFLGITFGMLCGYSATRIWFKDFQLVTMVFSTMLIGIGIDYSYHYFFSENRGKDFVKNLSVSFITTIIPFVLLYLTEIELLRQISVFSVFGLLGIYSFVLIIYPCFEFPKVLMTLKFNTKFYKIILSLLVLFSIVGFFGIRFNDSVSAMYTPSKKLLYAENLYNKVSGNNLHPAQIIMINGKNFDEILAAEEVVTQKLAEMNISYASISKFIPCVKRQKKNFELVQGLYDKKLDKYSDILTNNQIRKLKTQNFTPVIFSLNDNEFLNEFMLDKNTSMIFVFSDKSLDLKEGVVSITEDIEKYMKSYRLTLLKFLPVILVMIYLLLSCFYGFKKGLKLVISPYFGSLCAVGLTCLVFRGINLFSLISLFLVLGFTIDYSVFREKGESRVEDAVFISCLTTAFSFLLLALTGFRLISSITFVLFAGIAASYLCGYFLYSRKN